MNYIEIFLEALSAEKGRGQKTLDAYSSDLNSAQKAIGDLLKASEQDIQKYLSNLNEKPSSVARKASALRTFYKFLMLEKIIQTKRGKTLLLISFLFSFFDNLIK